MSNHTWLSFLRILGIICFGPNRKCQFTQHHVVNIGARQLAMQRSVLVVKLQLGPLHFPYLITWHFGQKKSDGSQGVLVEGWWCWISFASWSWLVEDVFFRCLLDMDRFKMLKSSPFQDVCRPYSQTSHTKCKTFHDPTPTEIGLWKVLSCLGVEQTLWRHLFIQCSLECLWQGAAVDFGLELIGDHVEWIRFGGCGVFPVFHGLRFGDANP